MTRWMIVFDSGYIPHISLEVSVVLIEFVEKYNDFLNFIDHFWIFYTK